MFKSEIRYPIFILNFKCYEEAIGENAIKLAKEAKKIVEETNVTIAIAPTAVDILNVKNFFNFVIAQHADPIDPGSYTGHIPVEAFKKAGVSGILINHSEKRLQDNQIEYLIKKCKRFDLTSIICGKDPEECYKLSKYNPDIIAIEPPELIGTGNSVSRYKPESISKTVELVKNFNKNIHVICGAGISDEEDVKIALELGAEGILVSSSIIKSKEPYEKIRKFAMIIKEWKS